MRSKRWYGLIGLLSLLGFVGVFTPERAFLGFFALRWTSSIFSSGRMKWRQDAFSAPPPWAFLRA